MDGSPMMLSGLKVLLAEDNATNQMVAMQMLETLGADVSLAVNGAEALERGLAGGFDVLLVDIEMPRVSGIDVIRSVRGAKGEVAATPIVALTAYVMEEHRAAIQAAGADGIIAKPIMSIEQFGRDILQGVGMRGGLPGLDTVQGGSDGSRSGVAATIDMAIYEGLCAAVGAEAMRELLGRVESDIADAGDRACRAMAAMDLAELRASTHILVAVAGAIGAVLLQDLATEVNRAAHASDGDTIAARLPFIEAEVAAVTVFVQERLTQ